MVNLVPQASLFIPLLDTPYLPTSVRYDPRSEWHTSALLSMAMETMTLPSQLRSLPGVSSSSLNKMETFLTSGGLPNYAHLRLRFDDYDDHHTATARPGSQIREAQMGKRPVGSRSPSIAAHDQYTDCFPESTPKSDHPSNQMLTALEVFRGRSNQLASDEDLAAIRVPSGETQRSVTAVTLSTSACLTHWQVSGPNSVSTARRCSCP